ncbi:MAG: hypothetical protein JG777_2791 [Clostridia bacterium]|jgi:uncharacterized membrane protein|uniref:putative ABC transporter permease n=1 Tax=Petroclostridium xylanilyticum TaxID=1792311 RepID=UPI000B980E61|nr:putative ABC transporter permease [Petroclostridium xylanilyticum]MBZ4647302.1 hypothetical protein [Clostridia bacterium]
MYSAYFPGLDSYLALFYYFVIYSFLGWCMETIYATYKEKRFANRGFLNGPFCPVYGFGALILIILLEPIRNPLLLFICAMVLTSILEYITGLILEKSFHSTWWDYSSQPFNIKGRICLRFSIYWGAVSVIILRVFHPHIQRIIMFIPVRYGIMVFYILSLYFLADFIIAVISAINLNFRLRQLHSISVELKSRIEHAKELTIEKIEEVEGKLQELRDRYEFLLHRKDIGHSRLIRAFPTLRSKKFDSMLKEIRKVINHKKM